MEKLGRCLSFINLFESQDLSKQVALSFHSLFFLLFGLENYHFEITFVGKRPPRNESNTE